MISQIHVIFAAVSGLLAGLLVGLGIWLRAKSRWQNEKEALKIRIVTLEKEQEPVVPNEQDRPIEIGRTSEIQRPIHGRLHPFPCGTQRILFGGTSGS